MIDDEDNALDTLQDEADKAYQRHAARQTAKGLLVVLIFLVETYMRMFGVIALWHVPPWALPLVAVLLGVVVGLMARNIVRIVRKRRDRARRQLTKGQLQEERFEEMRKRRAEIASGHPLLRSLRKPNGWVDLVLAAGFAACTAVVVQDWYGDVPAALVGIGCFLVAAVAQPVVGDWAFKDMADAALFVDPSVPRDTPET
ncbi:hypothetical protein CU254_41340 (plasmid) [Amycolatopsis sp. AA4]|uniref:hypothetical protein n=1 Tax=Actinomycetes TaxID=1760 RepID=UPI0001B55C0F|nr:MULTISPECIES: hypothetical protein [Actinomycetes]ATY17033.1 hypothetical protein CU254_41340 [Amycolatopsis sp. AA4]